jgi:molybdate-binding protein
VVVAAGKFVGLERAAHVGRLIAEDVKAGDVPLGLTLRDIIQANELAFDPPYSEARLQALVRARLEAERGADDER